MLTLPRFVHSPLELMPPTIRSASSAPFHAPCYAACHGGGCWEDEWLAIAIAAAP